MYYSLRFDFIQQVLQNKVPLYFQLSCVSLKKAKGITRVTGNVKKTKNKQKRGLAEHYKTGIPL